MKQLLIMLVSMLLLSSTAPAQNAKKIPDGNYVAVTIKDTTLATNTGNTYTDSKGIVYPVYKTKNDKLFVMRTSKAGNNYRQYLKIH